MHSKEVQELIAQLANDLGLDRPYGVLTGEHLDKNGRKYKSVTFGRPRTLDAEVRIYNGSFMILRTSRAGGEVYRNVDELVAAIKEL